MSDSCLRTADIQAAEIGVEHISEGKDAVRGVNSGGRTGFVTAVGDILAAVVENERGRRPETEYSYEW